MELMFIFMEQSMTASVDPNSLNNIMKACDLHADI